MAEIIEGNYTGRGMRFGIVVSRFNEYVTKMLLEGALNELRRSGVQEQDLHVLWTPGAFEIPLAVQALAKSRNLDAIVSLGCIVRGETSHYEHLAQTVSDSLQQMALAMGLPVGFGVITAGNVQQAIDRAGGKHGNKGREAALSVLQMAGMLRELKGKDKSKETLDSLIAQEFAR